MFVDSCTNSVANGFGIFSNVYAESIPIYCSRVIVLVTIVHSTSLKSGGAFKIFSQ